MSKGFSPNASTFAPGGVPIPVSPIYATQVLSADGAITLESGIVSITKTSAAAITLAAPAEDGQLLTIISETAFAHTITTVSPGYNNNASYLVVTLDPQIGDVLVVYSRNGVWWIVKQSANGPGHSIQAISGDGAISIKNGLVVLSKGSAAAITLADPTTGVDDFSRLSVITSTAQAHVITDATSGFNAKGSSGTATFTAAIGNGVELVAYQGKWYTVTKNGVTIA